MVIVNTSSGDTFAFDVTEEDSLAELTTLLSSGHATALSIQHKGVINALPLPKRFRRAEFGAEPLWNGEGPPIGERVYCQADGVLVSLTCTFASSLVRCDVRNMGKQRFDPRGRKGWISE